MTLRDAIDQDVYRIDDEQFTDADFQAMSIDELETMKLRISKKISGLSDAIHKWKITNDNGSEADSKERYLSLRSALSISERVAAYVKALIKQNTRMSRTTGDIFMEKAMTVLPREVYEQILRSAQGEMQTLREGNHGTVCQ